MTRQQEMEAIAQKIRARQELTDDEKVKARQGLATHARKNTSAAPRTAAKKGGGVNRAELWRKAMAANSEATADRPSAAATDKAVADDGESRSGKSYAAMWRSAHERASLLPPIRGDE